MRLPMPSKDVVTAGGFIYLGALGPPAGSAAGIAAQTRGVIERAGTRARHGRLIARPGRGRHGVPEVRRGLPGDERRVWHVLAGKPADPDDDRHRAGDARCGRGDVDGRGSVRRGADGRPSGGLAALPEPLQLRDQVGRHGVPLRARVAQGPRQRGRGGRRAGADHGHHGHRRRDPRGRRPDAREHRLGANLPAGGVVVPADERRVPCLLS